MLVRQKKLNRLEYKNEGNGCDVEKYTQAQVLNHFHMEEIRRVLFDLNRVPSRKALWMLRVSAVLDFITLFAWSYSTASSDDLYWYISTVLMLIAVQWNAFQEDKVKDFVSKYLAQCEVVSLHFRKLLITYIVDERVGVLNSIEIEKAWTMDLKGGEPRPRQIFFPSFFGQNVYYYGFYLSELTDQQISFTQVEQVLSECSRLRAPHCLLNKVFRHLYPLIAWFFLLRYYVSQDTDLAKEFLMWTFILILTHIIIYIRQFTVVRSYLDSLNFSLCETGILWKTRGHFCETVILQLPTDEDWTSDSSSS